MYKPERVMNHQSKETRCLQSQTGRGSLAICIRFYYSHGIRG